MVKKNLVNKNVVRALSIGLSLAMMSQPLTAMAQVEGDATGDSTGTSENQSAAKTSAEVAQDELSDVQDAVSGDLGSVSKTENAVSEVGTLLDDDSKAKVAEDEAVSTDDVEGALYGGNNEDKVAEIEGKVAGIQTELDKITGESGEALLNSLDAAADKVVTDAEKDIVKPAEGAVKDAVKAVDEAGTNITNATNIPGVNAAYNTAEEAVNAAQTALDNASKAMETAKTNLDDAITAYNNKRAELVAAKQNAFDKAVEANKELKELRDDGSKDTQDEEFVNEDPVVADEDAAAAVAVETEDLRDGRQVIIADAVLEDEYNDELKKLEEAVEAAREKYLETSYGKVAAIESALQARVSNGETPKFFNGSVPKDGEKVVNEDLNKKIDLKTCTYADLFLEIVRSYYAEEVLDGATVTGMEWHRLNGDYYYENGTKSSRGDVLNYCKVQYTDKDGNSKETLLGYKLANENKSNSFGGIVIFEKTEHTVLDKKDLTAKQIEDLESGKVVTVNGKQVVKATGSDQYVAFEGDGTVDGTDVVDDNDATDDNKTVVIDEDSKVTTWNYQNGVLTKTVTADVTTTTYTGATLDAKTPALASEDEAKAAYIADLKAKIPAGQSAVITVGESTAEVKIVEVKIVNDKLVDAVTGDEITTANVANYGYVKDDAVINNTLSGYKVSGSYSTVSTKSKTWSEDFETELGADLWESTVYEIEKSAFINDYDTVNGSGPQSLKDFFTGQWGGSYSGYQLVGNPVYSGPGKQSYYDGRILFVDDYDYTFNRTVTVTYEEVKSVTLDYHEILGFVNNMSESQVLELAKSQIAAAGGVMLGKVNLDGNAGKITVLYVPATTKNDVKLEVTDKANLESAFGTYLANQGISANRVAVDKENAKAIYKDANGVETDLASVTKFGYQKVDFNLKSVSSALATISTRTWNTTDETNKITGQTVTEYRNDNWYSGDVILSTKEKKAGEDNFTYKTDGKGGAKNVTVITGQKEDGVAFSADLNAGIAKLAKYDDSLTAIQEAEAKVIAAEKEVVELEKAINAIKFGNNDSSLAALQGRLVDAQNTLNTAKQNLIALQALRDARISALTSAPSGEGGGETGDEGGTTTPGATGLLPGAEAPLAAAPAMFVAAPGGAGAPAAAVAEDNTVTLTEQRTALSDAAPEAQTEQATENIDDGKTALAAAPVSEETLSWWWLLIIAVLGGAGYAMYRKFHNKKDEKTTN